MLGWFLDALLPSPCLHCSEVMYRTDGSIALGDLQLCPRCAAHVSWHHHARCRLCALRLPAPRHAECLPCLRHPPPWQRLYCIAEYAAPLDTVIRAFKHGSLVWLAEPLAKRCWLAHAEELLAYDALVPIPLHFWRQRQRGFNQSEVLACHLGALLGRPVTQLLRRSHGPALSTLSHDDRRSWARRTLHLGRRLPGLSRFRARQAPRGARLLVVDDVLTTGSTAARACQLLRRAGAAHVAVLTVARTP